MCSEESRTFQGSGRRKLTEMRFTVLLVTLIYLTGRHGVRCGIFNAGPYSLKLIRHEQCEDQGTGEGIQDLRFTKKSTHKGYLKGTIVVPYDYDDNVHGEMNFSRFGSRGWGMNAYHTKSKNFCEGFLTKSPTMFEFYFKSWGIEKPSCPIKAGNYTMEMDTDLPRLVKMPMLPYGTYRISQALSHGDPPRRIVCGVWYISCTEIPRT